MDTSPWSGLLWMDTSCFSKGCLKIFVQPTEHQLEENIRAIKRDEHTGKLKPLPPNQPWPTSSEPLLTSVSSLSSVSFPVLGKLLLFSIFPNPSAPGTYTPQTFTVNSESRTVSLSGAVTVTSNFGNTRTKNEEGKTTLAYCKLSGPPEIEEKWGYIMSVSHRQSRISEWWRRGLTCEGSLSIPTKLWREVRTSEVNLAMSRCLAELWPESLRMWLG